MPYEASTVFDFSSVFPDTIPQSQLIPGTGRPRRQSSTIHRCKSKTILSVGWELNQTKKRQLVPEVTTVSHSGTTQRPKTRRKSTNPVKRKPTYNHRYEAGPKYTSPKTTQMQKNTKPQDTVTTPVKTKPSKTTRRPHRKWIVVPPGLHEPQRKKPKTATRNNLTPSSPTHDLTQNTLDSYLTPKNLPECILTVHSTAPPPGSKAKGILTTDLHYSAPETSLDDILTQPPIISV